MDELDGFDDFWKVYPRHVGKLDAQKAYRQAIKMVSSATIVNAARKYAFECIGKDMQYVKLPAGWLRAGRWGDILSYTVDKPEDVHPIMCQGKDGNWYPTGDTVPVNPNKIFVRDGTPEMDAWDAWWKATKGVRAPRSRKLDGWWFPSAQPPVFA